MVFGTYICARYGKHGAAKPFVENNSLNFVISQWHASITFDDNYDSIYQFDLTKCSISEFYYNFHFVKNSGMTFEEFYNHLIAKDLSKKIMILMASSDIFDFFSAKPTVRFYKNQNSSKFESLEIYGQVKMLSGFKNFIMNYMEDDGIIKSTVMIPGIPLEEIGVIKIGRYYNYSVSNVNKYWDYIVAK
uniref:Uncharacterized protein n=1 Tax=Panagrolaimus davidi TaxID=227884 RepID=A0A914QBG4_9BILA